MAKDGAMPEKEHPVDNFLNGDKLKPVEKEIKELFPTEIIMNIDGGFFIKSKKDTPRTLLLDFSKRNFFVHLMFINGINRKKSINSGQEFELLKNDFLIFLRSGINEVPKFKKWEKVS